MADSKILRNLTSKDILPIDVNMSSASSLSEACETLMSSVPTYTGFMGTMIYSGQGYFVIGCKREAAQCNLLTVGYGTYPIRIHIYDNGTYTHMNVAYV